MSGNEPGKVEGELGQVVRYEEKICKGPGQETRRPPGPVTGGSGTRIWYETKLQKVWLMGGGLETLKKILLYLISYRETLKNFK